MEDRYSRRSFCVRLVMAAAGAAAVRAVPAIADGGGAWVVLGPASKYSHQTVTPAAIPKAAGGGQAFVVHGDGDTFTVFGARCTHKGCPLSWDKGASLFMCPCHGGKFDTTGKVVAGPPPRPLDTIASHVDAQGQLCVKSA